MAFGLLAQVRFQVPAGLCAVSARADARGKTGAQVFCDAARVFNPFFIFGIPETYVSGLRGRSDLCRVCSESHYIDEGA